MINVLVNREEIRVEGELLSFQEYFINNNELFSKLKNILFTYKNIKRLSINDKYLSIDIIGKDYHLDIKVYKNVIRIMSFNGSENDVPNFENLKEDLLNLWKVIRPVESIKEVE